MSLKNGGRIHVTERLTFDIHAASKNNLFWELWRDLCESEVDGLQVKYEVKSVKQVFDNKPDVVFQKSSELYWEDYEYTPEATAVGYGPNKWFHSPGPYNEYNRQYECVFFYVNGLYREKPTFEIEYEMTNASLRYEDCSELYLCMFSEDSVNYLNSFNGKILIPNKDMPKTGNYYVNTYGTNANNFAYTESSTSNPGYYTFEFNLDKSDLKFSPYNEFIEFDLVAFGDDKHIFTDYAPNNIYSNEPALQELKDEHEYYNNTNLKYAKIKLFILCICILCSFLLIKKYLRTDDEFEQKYNIYTPTMDIDFFRDIPSNLDPVFASNLAFCRHKNKKANQDGYSAIVLSLARKKYIEIERINPSSDWSFKNVKIVLKNQEPIKLHPDLKSVQESINEIYEDMYKDIVDTREPLSKSEELYLNLIKRYAINSELAMSSFQTRVSMDYESTDSFISNMEKSITEIGVSQGYYQKANFREPETKLKSKSSTSLIVGILILFANIISYNTRLGFAFGGFFILGASFLYGSYIYNYLSKKYLLLTQFGEDEYVKWKGLYNFLNSETLIKERSLVELPLWEQYLVYATAFGISEKVINALKIRCPEIKMVDNTILSNPYYRSTNFYHSNRSFRTSAYRASHISRSGGGYGGYGYGGGRGGGGGGGGH